MPEIRTDVFAMVNSRAEAPPLSESRSDSVPTAPTVIDRGDGRVAKLFLGAPGSNVVNVSGITRVTNGGLAVVVAVAGAAAEYATAQSTVVIGGQTFIPITGPNYGNLQRVVGSWVQDSGAPMAGASGTITLNDAAGAALVVEQVAVLVVSTPATMSVPILKNYQRDDYVAEGFSSTIAGNRINSSATPPASFWLIGLGVVRPGAGGVYAATISKGADSETMLSAANDLVNDNVFFVTDRTVATPAPSTNYLATVTLNPGAFWLSQTISFQP